MIKRILVPLDSSALSEATVLPYVEALAVPLKATVHLLQVLAVPSGRSGGLFKAAAAFLTDVRLPGSEADLETAQHPVYKESEMASLEAEAKSRLMPVAERLHAKGIAVEVAVVFGRPAGGILQYIDQAKIDLIVMSTHGEGGPDGYAFGPTADRVARRSPIPVTLVRPEEVSRSLPMPRSETEHA